MAHYAFLDKNNIVVEVIVGKDEDDLTDVVSSWEEYYSQDRNLVCKRTSYNGNIRKNFAGIGYLYSEELDAFVPPKPFESWILNENTGRWESPIAYPEDGLFYVWNEDINGWDTAENVFPPIIESPVIVE